MQSILPQVKRHCRDQIITYHDCVENNIASYDTKCKEARAALTKCAEENVNELKQVKKDCDADINAFKQCADDNPANPNACFEQMKKLQGCIKGSLGDLPFGENYTGTDLV